MNTVVKWGDSYRVNASQWNGRQSRAQRMTRAAARKVARELRASGMEDVRVITLVRDFEVVGVRDEQIDGGWFRIVSLVGADDTEIDLERAPDGTVTWTNADGHDVASCVSKASKAAAIAALDSAPSAP
ncbi:MAG: hypothetical protein EKK55_05210 [Rhodocyclaceae bacterium]|nr:MAG: hypothetical protein EKK55_05210 [Rhodocyclaceae bacterium]